MASPPYNNTIIPCIDDLRCPGNSQCMYENYATNKTNMICTCPPDWGNGGTLCNEYGATSYFQMVFHSIMIIVFAALLTLILLDSRRLYLQKKLTSLDAKATTLILLALGVGFSLIMHIGNLLTYAYPEKIIMFYNPILGYRKSTFVRTLRAITTTAFSFFLIASILNIGILWLEVAIASNKFKKLNNPQISKKYIIFVAVVDLILAIVMAVTFSISETLVAVGSVPIAAFILVVYGYSAYAISKVMKEQSSSDNRVTTGDETTSHIQTKKHKSERDHKMIEALRKIRKSTLIVISSMLLSSVVPIIYISVDTEQRKFHQPPNSLYYPICFLDFTYVCEAVIFFAVYWYTHGNIRGTNKISEHKNEEVQLRVSPGTGESSSARVHSPQ